MITRNVKKSWIITEDQDTRVASNPVPKEIAKVMIGDQPGILKVCLGFSVNPGTPFDLPTSYATQLATALTEATADVTPAPVDPPPAANIIVK